MESLRTFLESPLARHPRLLLRKAADRLGLRSKNSPLPPPPAAQLIYPHHWAGDLSAWTKQVPLHPTRLPFGRVFGHDFDETLLLKLCTNGPVRGARDLTGDIKLIWDYSRGHPLFLNVCAAHETIGENASFIRRWLSANQNTNGPTWSCAMDVAIRAVNWIFADALAGGELGRRVGVTEWSNWLWRHGANIWQNLESRIIPSNHYLADVLGLAVVGSSFPQDATAQNWLRFARNEFPRALLAQTRRDGGLNEASLRYHAFVTEMALLCRLALGKPFPKAAEERLQAMCQILADFRDADGDVFAFGDDDSGRVLALDFNSPLGRGDILLKLAAAQLNREFTPAPSAVCPESGWWVRRNKEFVVALEYGGAGLRGLGGHAHNDDLSICVEYQGHPLFVDPGSYIYTPDPEARNRFRSAYSHNTLIVDRHEPVELTPDLFLLRSRDTPSAATQLAGGTWSFRRALHSGVSHQREITSGPDKVIVTDRIEGTGRHHLEWRFHLHPHWTPQIKPGGFVLNLNNTTRINLDSTSTNLSLELMSGEFSPEYGHIFPTKVCRISGDVELPCTVEWQLHSD